MRERKNNLDLLRIISMLFIVSLHYLGVGGAFYILASLAASITEFYNIGSGNVSLLTCNYFIASGLEALSIVGVNCFVLISGYFLINGTFKCKKIWQISLTTIFYSLSLFLIYSAIYEFTISNMIPSILPISMSTYWFITVYIILYLLSPYINVLCNSLSQKQHLMLIVILVLVFSVWKCVLPIAETIDDRKGYSLSWFIVLYICGAYIKKYGVKLFKKNCFNFLSYIGISIFMVIAKISLILASSKLSILAKAQNLFYHYDSCTVLLASIFLFVFFSRIKCEGVFWSRVIKFVTPSVFSVYLIHENFLWREFWWNELLRSNAMVSSPVFIVHFLMSIVLIFIGCVIIDQLRKGLFFVVSKCRAFWVREVK